MATSPEIDSLFLSSSPTRYSSGPSEEVEMLLAQARTVNCLDPAIESVISMSRNAFFETFSRHISLIKSRSQAFQDCHVTIFDKVLLELTQHGSDLVDPAAIQYFCDEFLAVPVGASPAEKTSALTSTLLTSKSVNPDTDAPETETGSASHSNGDNFTSKYSEKKSLFGHQLHDLEPVTLVALAADVGPSMSRLWSVYNQAKKEFYAVADTNNIAKQTTAKFLRDTAENTLQYIQSKGADQRLAHEVEANLEVAKHIAMTLHGGKKRKFDQPDSADAVEWDTSKQGARPGSAKVKRRNMKFERMPRNRDSTNRRDFAGHDRALAQFQRSKISGEDTQGQLSAVIELFPVEPSTKWKKKQVSHLLQPGRGHSNIPFGYTRRVDSYQPEG